MARDARLKDERRRELVIYQAAHKCVDEDKTVFQTSKELMLGYGTIFRMLTNELRFIDFNLYEACKEVRERHKHESKRGGKKNDWPAQIKRQD